MLRAGKPPPRLISRDGHPALLEARGQLHEHGEVGGVEPGGGDLGADVGVEPHHLDVLAPRGQLEDGRRSR